MNVFIPCFVLFEHISIFYFFFLSHFVVLSAEQRQRLAADQRRREYHEEQRNEFESHAEEENDGENSNHSAGGHIGSGSIIVFRDHSTQVTQVTGLRLTLAEPCRVLQNRFYKAN